VYVISYRRGKIPREKEDTLIENGQIIILLVMWFFQIVYFCFFCL
jgi:hypothetical protein